MLSEKMTTNDTAMQFDFHAELVEILPKLRIQALSFTHNAAAADDLVQDAVTNALAAQHSFTPGTNFKAWMYRIVRNRFISNVRKRREIADTENWAESALTCSGGHEDRLVLKELQRGISQLPVDQRSALFMVVLDGRSYEEVSEAMGCAVGTAKTRVFRARRQLQMYLAGDGDLQTIRAALVRQESYSKRHEAQPPT